MSASVTTQDAGPLEPHVARWVATCLLDGFSAAQIAPKLARFHPDVTDPEAAVERIRTDPILQAGLVAARRRDKLAALLDALGRQLRQSNAVSRVPVITDPTPRDFYDNFYFTNRPVVLRGLMEHWPALKTWTPESFAGSYGAEIVEVQVGRKGDPRYEERFDEHRGRMPLSAFVDTVARGGNDVYLAAKNRLLDQPAFAALLDDFDYPAGFLDGSRPAIPRLWVGGAGTITPLHHDSANILFGQVFGRKLVRLIPPYEISNVGNDRSCFSSIDIDAPDFHRHPEFRNVSVLEVVVEPGEFLLLPLGWWHAVRSLETSISLSFQNFAVAGAPVIWRHNPRPRVHHG